MQHVFSLGVISDGNIWRRLEILVQKLHVNIGAEFRIPQRPNIRWGHILRTRAGWSDGRQTLHATQGLTRPVKVYHAPASWPECRRLFAFLPNSLARLLLRSGF